MSKAEAARRAADGALFEYSARFEGQELLFPEAKAQILAAVAGPIPDTRSRSAADRNGPSLVLESAILRASLGPTPGIL